MRRVRSGSLPAVVADAALERFAEDLQSGAFTLLPLLDEQVMVAEALLNRIKVPLRALDALHLAAAQAIRAQDFATADRQLAVAAESLQLSVHYFGNLR
jgi:predicted nucleic acid-binding protein